ncbi:MAG: SCO7613 C-terminal domain-containing membrane protein, partial [Nitriliruptoraceae bacterium]
LLAGVVAGALAAVSSRSLTARGTAVATGLAVTTLPVGWVLLGDAALLRAVALLIAGLVLAAAGLLAARLALAHVGAAVATLGSWSLLAELDVTALDLWLLPVAAQVLLAGRGASRSGPTSSWVAEAPAVAMVGLPAVLERLTGGPGWHGLLAGGVAIVAVIAGGRRGRRGPLVVGAVVLVAIVGVETLTVVATLPTWAWLAAGGVVLLVAGASIERLGQTPRQAAGRLAAGLRDRPAGAGRGGAGRPGGTP